MYNRATNKCQWLYTKRTDKTICDRPCVGQLCSYHIQQKRRVLSNVLPTAQGQLLDYVFNAEVKRR